MRRRALDERDERRHPVERWLVPVAFAGILVAVLALQPRIHGFPSLPHHGWVTSHVLAIFQRSTPEHGFVGHAGEWQDPSGTLQYYYFNRTPMPFAALAHLILLPERDDLDAYMHLGRQLYNVIFWLTLVVTHLFLRRCRFDGAHAIAATLLAGSGYYFLEYKDLIEFHRPGTLATVLALHSIARVRAGGSKRVFFAEVCVAALLGEAAPACFIYAAWSVVEATRALRKRDFCIADFAASTHVRAFALCFAITATCVAYNILLEARIRGVAITETDIVDAARRRLGGRDEAFSAIQRSKLAWPSFLATVGGRTALGTVPFPIALLAKRGTIPTAGAVAVGIACLAFAAWSWRRRSRDLDDVLAIAVVGSVAWFLALRRLVAFHDYTTTLLVGVHVLIIAACLRGLGKVHSRFAMTAALGLHLWCLVALRRDHEASAGPIATLTEEYRAIRSRLGSSPHRVFLAEKREEHIKGAPYAPFFYLHGHSLVTDEKTAEFVIARRRIDSLELLTPSHRAVFLHLGAAGHGAATAENATDARRE